MIMTEQPIYNSETKIVTFAGKEYRLIENPRPKLTDDNFVAIMAILAKDTNQPEVLTLKNEYHYMALAVDGNGQEYEIRWDLWDSACHLPIEQWRNEVRWQYPVSIRTPYIAEFDADGFFMRGSRVNVYPAQEDVCAIECERS